MPSYPPDAFQGVAPPPGVRRTIAVGGGRGGVGKSVLAVNLGRAQCMRHKILLMDRGPGIEHRIDGSIDSASPHHGWKKMA